MATMTIGQVAESTGLAVETVRYYEREGLIPEPPRSPSGYRQYDADTVRRLRFVVRAKALGFTLREIAELLDLRIDSENNCARVRSHAAAKIADIQKRIAQLDAMRQALQGLVAQCDGDRPISTCPILDALEQDT